MIAILEPTSGSLIRGYSPRNVKCYTVLQKNEVTNEKKGILSFYSDNIKISMRANSIAMDLMLRLTVLIINKRKDTHHKYSKCTLNIVKFLIGFGTLFWPIFVDFRNEATSLCVNNSINKDVK